MIQLRRNTTTKRAAAAKRKVKTQEELDHIAALVASESKPCDHCSAAVHWLEAFPAQLNGTGLACLSCYQLHVDSKRTDAERYAVIMGTFCK